MKHLRLTRYFTEELAPPAPCADHAILVNARPYEVCGPICFAYVDSTIVPTVQKAIEIFGYVLVDAALPLTARASWCKRGTENPSVWDVEEGPDSIAGSWVQQARLAIHKYRTENGKVLFGCNFHGRAVEMTEDFWMYNDLRTPYAGGPIYGPYISIDGHVLVCPELFRPTPGVDLDKLKADAR